MTKKMNPEALQGNLILLDKKTERFLEQAKSKGTLDPKVEKFTKLISDKLFCENLLAVDSAEEAQALFMENGLELTIDEVNAYGEQISAVSHKLIENGGEISEEELERVAGGVVPEVASVSLFSSSLASGGAAGTAAFPVVGTIIGVAVAAAVTATIIYRDEVWSGIKKVGRWFKSWF